jgi:hypothetical protein
MGILIAYPWLALVASGVFALLWLKTGSRMAAFVALLWAFYAGYEFLVHARVLCTGECNIRVDLLLVYPVLLVLSIGAVLSSFRAHRRTRHAA